MLVLATVLYAGTGYLIMVPRPGNAIGARLALVGLLVGWLSVVVSVLTGYLLLLLVLLFPDGRHPGRHLRARATVQVT